VVAPKPAPTKLVDGVAVGVEDPPPNGKLAAEVAGGWAGAGMDDAAPPAAPNANAGGA